MDSLLILMMPILAQNPCTHTHHCTLVNPCDAFTIRQVFTPNPDQNVYAEALSIFSWVSHTVQS